jgi:hypothetical protein
MRITLQTRILALGVLALAAFTTQSAMAQCQLKVPFSFVAAGKIYPAGTYTVKENKEVGLVALEGQGRSLTWMAIASHPESKDAVTLTFDRRGEIYYLSTMQYGSFVTPRMDKHIRETIPGPELASVKP